MNSSVTYYSRKVHRYLGIFIGVQFLLWTLGGLYFSWTDIEEIRGEHLRSEVKTVSNSQDLVSPSLALSEISHENAKLKTIQLVEILGNPFYEIVLTAENGKEKTFVADATTGKVRKEFTKAEASEIASNSLLKKSRVRSIEVLTEENVGAHHEYREKPLPAYAVNFEYPSDLTVYVSGATGKVESFRTNKWRIFDFLWMLHTMDYNGRDNINNYILRAFSILGIATIFSGFVLFFITSPVFRKRNISK